MSKNENNIANNVVDKLNKLVKLDPDFTNKIVNTRYQVNENYVNSEFICSDDEAGLIGVLSGLILDNEKYRFCANYDEDNKLFGFSLLENVDGKFVKVE